MSMNTGRKPHVQPTTGELEEENVRASVKTSAKGGRAVVLIVKHRWRHNRTHSTSDKNLVRTRPRPLTSNLEDTCKVTT